MKNNLIQNNLRKIRENLLMSKAELSRKARVSQLTIARIENGNHCRLETQRKLLKALGFKLSERAKVFPDFES